MHEVEGYRLSGQNEPEAHHHTPKWLSKRFCDDEGLLWWRRRDWPAGELLHHPPKRVFVENNLNTRYADDGTKDVRVEKALAAIDGRMADITAHLIDQATLHALGLREAHALPEQMDRLLHCTLRFDGWVSPLSWLTMLGWDDVYDDRWRGVIPQRNTRVALCDPLARAMLRHPVRLCMHTLRGLEDSAFALDVYLWDAWRRVGPKPAPRLVEAYQALAEHPVPSPDPDALGAFEHALCEVRETIAGLEAEVRDEPAGLVYALPRKTPPTPASSWRLP